MASEVKTLGTAGWVQTLVIGRHPQKTLRRLALIIGAGAIAFLLFRYVISPIHINGTSMFPTFQNGDFNFINRLAYLRHEPSRGDIVGIRYSGDGMKSVMLVKRIVALPGETISFARDGVYINGERLVEPYLRTPASGWESPPKHLGPQEYYVAGDNRQTSWMGATERRRIIGRVMLGGNP